jgi:hypothetical protein
MCCLDWIVLITHIYFGLYIPVGCNALMLTSNWVYWRMHCFTSDKAFYDCDATLINYVLSILKFSKYACFFGLYISMGYTGLMLTPYWVFIFVWDVLPLSFEFTAACDNLQIVYGIVSQRF